ncbi:hypothetical protein [Paracoccus alkanivorans]|nr:hypothetical protein [Paracoccus alkanivorans]
MISAIDADREVIIGQNTELPGEPSHNVDPAAWHTQTLQRIANQWPSSNI